MAHFRQTTTPLPDLNRNAPNGKPETAHLSMVTVSDWPGIVSSARMVYRQNECTMVYPDDFSEVLMHDRGTPTSQKAIDVQHELVFTPETIATLQRQVHRFYADGPVAQLLTA